MGVFNICRNAESPLHQLTFIKAFLAPVFQIMANLNKGHWSHLCAINISNIVWDIKMIGMMMTFSPLPMAEQPKW